MVSIFRGHMRDAKDALYAMSNLERYFHLFWLAGPFILLIERSPADLWLSLLAVSFVIVVSRCARAGGCALPGSVVRFCFGLSPDCRNRFITASLLHWRDPGVVRVPTFWNGGDVLVGRDKRLVCDVILRERRYVDHGRHQHVGTDYGGAARRPSVCMVIWCQATIWPACLPAF